MTASTDTKNKTIADDANKQERFGRKPRFMSGKSTALLTKSEDKNPINSKASAK